MEKVKVLMPILLKGVMLYAALICFIFIVAGMRNAWKNDGELTHHIKLMFEFFWPLILPAAFIAAAINLFSITRQLKNDR